MRQMKIALFSFFNDCYSGGRIHAWFIAEGLANRGHDVTVFTNQKPGFIKDFTCYPAHEKIWIEILDNFCTSVIKAAFDVVVLVPDQCGDFHYYFNVIEFAQRIGARLILINFETPNWTEELNRYVVDSTVENGIWEASKFADMILSSTLVSQEYAKKYFVFKGDANFEFCYPPIHTIIADKVEVQRRQRCICIISRFYPRHKNAHRLLELACKEMAGFDLILIDGTNQMDRRAKQYYVEACQRYNASFVYKACISEEEKFMLLKKSQLTLFPSMFEGFGLPPVESLYCGTPCIAFDLPVLKEVNGEALIYARMGDFDDFRDKVRDCLSHLERSGVNRKKVRYMGLFEGFSDRIDGVVQKLF